jgi:DNA repair protein RadC
MIVVHNHPSGDPTPSPEDVAVTREIVRAGKLLDSDVQQHLCSSCARNRITADLPPGH